MKSNGFLLDTHVWIWHLNADSTLPLKIRNIIDAAALEHELYLSAISVWEIAMLVSKEKIVLNTSCQAWINKALNLPGVNFVPLTPEIAIESCYLGNDFHGDPADRMILSSAKIERLCIITRDKKMISFCEKNNIDLLKA